METAVNISQSCNHFTASMKLHFLTARRDADSCKQTLESLLKLLEGSGPIVALWWRCSGVVVALQWQHGGAVMAIWWHYGGAMVAL